MDVPRVRASRHDRGPLERECGLELREAAQLGRADEREVAGVEDEHGPGPAATTYLHGDRLGFTPNVGLHGDGRRGLADPDGHRPPPCGEPFGADPFAARLHWSTATARPS